MEPRTLAQLLAASPIERFAAAVQATVARLVPGIQVVRHPGRLDLQDVMAEGVFQAPSLHLAITRVRRDGRPHGAHAIRLDCACFVVARAMVSGGLRVEAPAVAHALSARLLDILTDPAEARWGLDFTAPPGVDPEPEMKPLFTTAAAREGLQYYAVTWTQDVHELGRPIWDFDAPPAEGFFAIADPVTTLGDDGTTIATPDEEEAP